MTLKQSFSIWEYLPQSVLAIWQPHDRRHNPGRRDPHDRDRERHATVALKPVDYELGVGQWPDTDPHQTLKTQQTGEECAVAVH